MSTTINYYRQWLNLRGERPKTHYHLLGIPLLERDAAKIKQAAAKVRAKIEQQRGQGHDAAVERLVEEVNQAETLLLNTERKAKYDQKIREKLAAQEKKTGAAGSSATSSKRAKPAGSTPKTVAGSKSKSSSPPPAAEDDDDDDIDDLLPPGADDGDSASGDLPAPLTPGHFPTSAPPAGPDYTAAVPAPPGSPWHAGSGYAQEPPAPADVPRAVPVTPVAPVTAVPVAAVAPVTPVTPVAPVTPVTPVMPGSAGTPVGPVVSTARVMRRKRRPPVGMLIFGAGSVVVVLIGLLLFVTQSGPFAPQQTTTVANKGNTPSRPAAPGRPITVRGPAVYQGSSPPVEPVTPHVAPEAMDTPPVMATPDSGPGMSAPEMMAGESDPAAEAAVDHALLSVRYYLAQRDLDQADLQLAAAEAALAKAASKRADVLRVQALAGYVKQFWEAVRTAAQSLESGDQVTIAGITVGVVELLPDGIVLRQNGQNITHNYREMRSGLALGLAERALRKGDAATELVLGAFKVVNPTSERAEARAHWESAQQLGAADQVTDLLPELAVVVPEGFDPGKPAMVASVPGPQPQPRPQPRPMLEKRLPVPPVSELNKLITDLKSSRQQEFAAARSPDEKVALAGKLQAEADGQTEDLAARLVLLAAARDLAAEAFNFSLAYQVVERMTETHEADTLEMRAGVLALAGRTADAGDTAKSVVEQALALSDEARLALRYNEALSILRNAQVIARKSRDNQLLQTVTQRLDETTEERKLGI